MIKELWKPLEWTVNSKGEPMAVCPSHYYTIVKDGEKYTVRRIRYQDSHKDDCTGFASIDDAKKFAQDDYEAKMAKWIKPVDNWISIKDRLPDNEEFYLTYLFDGNSDTWEMQIKWWDKKHGFLPWDLIDDVTHWQKLPEPPKEVDNVQ